VEGGSRRAILAAFVANGGIAVAKFVGFAFTGARHPREPRAGAPGWVVVEVHPPLQVARAAGGAAGGPGALVGLLCALAGVGMAQVTGNARWDAAGSIAIGLLLGVIAVTLVIEMKSLLIGESALPATVDSIRAAIERDRSVRRLIHMKTQHWAPTSCWWRPRWSWTATSTSGRWRPPSTPWSGRSAPPSPAPG
jgi:hypothetical protein